MSSTASAGVSGDLHDVVRLGDGSLAVLIADVCGHGLSSALPAAFLQGVLAAAPGRGLPPAARLAALNAALAGRGAGAPPLLVTASAALFRAGKLAVAHCQAGHPAPLLVRGGRCTELAAGAPGRADGSGAPPHLLLGVTAHWRGRSSGVALARGDLLVLYTDGVVEAEAHSLERFGKARLMARLAAAGGGSAREAVQAVDGALADFTGGGAPGDDRTLVAVRVRTRDTD